MQLIVGLQPVADEAGSRGGAALPRDARRQSVTRRAGRIALAEHGTLSVTEIFDGSKLKFVVSLDSSTTGEYSGATLFQQPLCYDDNQCSYYLLRCTLRTSRESTSVKLVQLLYVLADFCCVEGADGRVVALLERALATMQPSWNKFNCLLVHAFDEEGSYSYGEATTAYDTHSYPFGGTADDRFSEFSGSMVKAVPKQLQSSNGTSQRPNACS